MPGTFAISRNSEVACIPNNSSTSCNSEELGQKCLYDDIFFTHMLNKAKFPVFLGCLSGTEQVFAVKIFPYEKDHINNCFLNEMQFTHLKHPNVISILHSEKEREAVFHDCNRKISYTVMELAPHGDLCDLLLSQKIEMDDKLARTFFHQIMAGLEYLHSMGVAHLDLKCDNLLLGEDYTLKICDFDQAYIRGQRRILSLGTENFRAPEIAKNKCRDPEAADIYSLGIILFTLKSGGNIPFVETGESQEMNFYSLLKMQPELFWKKHAAILKKDDSFFDEDFKSLFLSLTAMKSDKRSSIEQIKMSRWYTAPTYTSSEVQEICKNYLC